MTNKKIFPFLSPGRTGAVRVVNRKGRRFPGTGAAGRLL
jgi:hypothetical protein